MRRCNPPRGLDPEDTHLAPIRRQRLPCPAAIVSCSPRRCFPHVPTFGVFRGRIHNYQELCVRSREFHESWKIGVYRIVQEALTNACKHSKSEKVTVSMTQEGQDLRLEVRDWGIGFDPKSVEEGHFGLEGIRQRVRLLGGRLNAVRRLVVDDDAPVLPTQGLLRFSLGLAPPD